MAATLTVNIAAAPRPCRARNPIRRPYEEDRPHTSEAPAKTHQARHDDPPVPAQIAKPASRNHGRTYRDHVGTEHPLHIRGGLVEVDRHLRQRQADAKKSTCTQNMPTASAITQTGS